MLINNLKRHSFPQNVIAEVVSICNLRCPICPQKTLKRKHQSMSMDIWEKIVDEIKAESPETGLWPALMGEPTLLGEELLKMFTYAVKSGVKVHLNTNGNFEKEFLSSILETGISSIYFSLDAVYQSTYDKIRRGGDINLVEDNVKLAVLNKKPHQKIFVQFVVTEQNKNEVDNFKEFWEEFDVIVKIKPFLNWGKDSIGKINPGIDRIPCPWLLRHALIISDGRMVQCDSDYDGVYSPGDLNTQTIKEVWSGELAKRRERHWNCDFDFQPCRDCQDWSSGRAEFYKNGKQIDV